MFDTAQRWTQLAVGLASLTREFADSTYDEVGPNAAPSGQLTGLAGLVPGAAVGIMLAGQDAAFDHVAGWEARGHVLVSRVASAPGVAGALRLLHGFLEHWDDRFRAQQLEHQELAARFLAKAGPGTLDELLARIDLDSLIARVDVDEVVGSVDLDAVIDKVPIERVIDRIDLRAVVMETVAQVPVADLLREGTGAVAASTADVLRGQVTSATRLAGRPFRRTTSDAS